MTPYEGAKLAATLEVNAQAFAADLGVPPEAVVKLAERVRRMRPDERLNAALASGSIFDVLGATAPSCTSNPRNSTLFWNSLTFDGFNLSEFATTRSRTLSTPVNCSSNSRE